MAWVWALLVLALPASVHGNVFGADDRTPLAKDTRLGQAMGKVLGASLCTGTLVGHRLVLTAAHCVNWSSWSADEVFSTSFIPAEFGGTSAAINQPVAIEARSGGWRVDSDPRSGDWAILVLKEPPRTLEGKTFPWMEVDPTPVGANSPLSSAGYAFDFMSFSSPFWIESCKADRVTAEGEISHDCDGAAGASGGPILSSAPGPLRILGLTNSHLSDGTSGLHLSAYSPAYANVGAAAANFFAALEELRQLYPAPSEP